MYIIAYVAQVSTAGRTLAMGWTRTCYALGHLESAVKLMCSAVKSFFPHSIQIQIIKLIFILLKDNASKYKMSFLNDNFMY